jgi:type IV secretion system protein VirB6
VAITLGLELALLEPWLSDVLARRMAGEALPETPGELFVLASLFTIIVLAALYGCARVAHAFRLPMAIRSAAASAERAGAATASGTRVSTAGGSERVEVERTRAAAVASLMAATSRREAALASNANDPAPPNRTPAAATRVRDVQRTTIPLGRSFSRRPNARVSAQAGRRDAGS